MSDFEHGGKRTADDEPAPVIGRARRWSETEGRKALQARRASGLSQSAWCRQVGVGLHRLRYWVDRVDMPTDERAGFVMLAPAALPTAGAGGVLIDINGGCPRVMVRAGFDADLLRAVVAALSSDDSLAGARS